MTFYTLIRATADKLIREKGQEIIYRHTTGGEYDPATGENEAEMTDVTVRGAVFDFKNSDVDGTLILKTDKRVLIACDAMSLEPSKDGKLSIAGVEHSIIDVKPVNPGGMAVIYIVQARK